MAKNANLHKAKKEKNDEFYTRREDIENELCHYAEHFRDKVVYCNCDDPETSEFWQFFRRNFRPWGLKKLMATHYEPDEKNYAYMLEISDDTNGDGVVDWKDEPTITQIPCNGDFRSAYCIELLKEADIVVTNPPFSLFRQYVAQLMEYGKKFLIIGSMNAITYKEIFPLLKDNMIWLGYNHPKEFRTPNGGTQKFGNIMWFTNLDIPKRHTHLDLRGNYYYGHEDEYPKYDNYDAIECSKVSDIPSDYEPCWFKCPHAAECEYAQKEGAKDTIALCEKEEIEEEKCNGAIGVPITYIDKHNPEQFDIIGATESEGSGFSNGLLDNEKKIKQPTIKCDLCVDNDEDIKDNGSRAHGLTGSRANYPLVQANLYQAQEESVTESSACQSHSSISTVRNSLASYNYAHPTEKCQRESKTNPDAFMEDGVTRESSFRNAKKCNGIMGIPITFLDKYCPEQFMIVNALNRYVLINENALNEDIRSRHSHACNINGKATYYRLLIRKADYCK